MLCDFSVPVKELILTRTDIFISEMLALPVTMHSRYAISFTDSKEIDVTSLKNQTHKNYLSKPVCQLNIHHHHHHHHHRLFAHNEEHYESKVRGN